MARYEDLVEKVQQFANETHARRAGSFQCAAGCEACCHVELGVGRSEAERIARFVEGLDQVRRAALAERAAVEDGRCVMLDEAGLCAIYPARPLVCRTQGLPLGYEAGVVPAESVRFRARRLEVVCCPLNFEREAPADEDVLDAGRVDTMLALVTRLEGHVDPDDRVTLRAIAASTKAQGTG